MNMDILVAYDVSTESSAGRRRLRAVANICLAFGQRAQKSVFECAVNETQFELLKAKLIAAISEQEDNLRIYRLAQPKETYVWTYGRQHVLNVQDPIIF